MITDTELRLQGITVLAQALGSVEAERFVALIQREPFDYTKWRQDKWNHLSIDEISGRAMAVRHQEAKQDTAPDGDPATPQPRQ